MITKNKPNKVTTTLKVVITGEFYDDEASEETLRYCVEMNLEDAGFDVDVTLLKEREQKRMNHENTRMNDPVNHPAHYTSGKIEVIDFLEDQKFPFHLANAVKYISRAGKKDPEKTVQDLEKAIWYINRYIGLLQKAQDGE